jgi:hypothetical protein
MIEPGNWRSEEKNAPKKRKLPLNGSVTWGGGWGK